MPGYNRAEISAELTVVTTTEAERSPQEQVEAAKQAASDSGLAHEAGPETTVLAGGRSEVLEATRKVIEASLDAGAHIVEVKVEAQEDAATFDEGG
ncbi:MAG: thiamine-binding protein [Actinomycetota bacterium]|nr:thiamine-binding protein [Actinomycetota bacterium]